MRHVPLIDATGTQMLQEISKDLKNHYAKIIVTEVNSKQVLKELKDSRLLFAIGKGNFLVTFEEAFGKVKRKMNNKI